METVLEAFRNAARDDVPTCFIAYTIKGFGLPFAGHKDNHAGLMNPGQMALFQKLCRVDPGCEWERFTGLGVPAAELQRFLDRVPFTRHDGRCHDAEAIAVPVLPVLPGNPMSTQEAFGKILHDLAATDTALAASVVTTSPDVTVSTNLGGWVNRRGIFHRFEVADSFRDERVVSAQKWAMTPRGPCSARGCCRSARCMTRSSCAGSMR
jgi:pyruvate dehydrogenase E1 component